MSSPPDSQPLLPGAVVLDRYRVVEHVAVGGHSVVYRGQDERLQRPVCIKVFSRLPTEQGVSRASYEHFVQEAFALSRLTHPNTLRIYDFGHMTVERDEKKGDVPFQVCEFMNGGTLAQVVRDHGPQSASEALRVIGAMCDALDEAHQLGIIHRDIKPQNILFGMVGATRLPKLADFGIAKWTDQDEPSGGENRAGDTQVVAGHRMAMYSPSWAAPEQLSGQKVSAATDIYSLAVVAVYTLTGTPIFAFDDVYEGYKRRRRPRELLRTAFAPFETPDAIIDVLAKALAFAPEDRQVKVSELFNALDHGFQPSRQRGPTRSSPTDQGVDPQVPPPLAPMAVGSIGGVRARKSEPPPLPPSAPAGSRRTIPGIAVSTPGTEVAGLETALRPADAEPARANTPPIAVLAPALVPQLQGHPGTPPRRVLVSPTAFGIGDRMAHFAQLTEGTVDLADAAAGVRIRITVMPHVAGVRTIHLKGLSSFIAHPGQRPTSAIQVHGDAEFTLVSGGQQVLATCRLSVGGPAAGHTVFQVGPEAIAVGLDDCAEVLLIDFGPGRACHFVYTPGPGLLRASARGQPRTTR
jgi:serine/threonine-protein kinase